MRASSTQASHVPCLKFQVILQLGHAGYVYAVAPDGQRFLMLKNVDKDPQINVVLKWFEELKRLVPTEN